jgi:hypothetical protein
MVSCGCYISYGENNGPKTWKIANVVYTRFEQIKIEQFLFEKGSVEFYSTLQEDVLRSTRKK